MIDLQVALAARAKGQVAGTLQAAESAMLGKQALEQARIRAVNQ
jgi:hypothetical protein